MNFLNRIPFVEELGMELRRLGGGESEIELKLREQLTNSIAQAHGGAIMTLLDVAMAHAARSPDINEGETPNVVTIEMKTTFMRPGTGVLKARGKLVHRAGTMVFCEGSVLDAEDRLLAHATGTFKYVRQAPSSGTNRVAGC